MVRTIKPVLDYLLCEEVREETAAVTTTGVSDHWQRYKVLAVGPGKYEFGMFIEPSVKAGDEIYVDRHAEANSPDDLKAEGQYLIVGSRVTAIIEREGK